MKKLLSLVLAALMLLSFAACSSNNGNGGQTDNTPEEPISELLPIINPDITSAATTIAVGGNNFFAVIDNEGGMHVYYDSNDLFDKYNPDPYHSSKALDRAKKWTDMIAISASKNGLYGIKKDGTVVGEYLNSLAADDWTQHGYDQWNNIVQISVSPYFLLGLDNSGKVFKYGADTKYSSNKEYGDLNSVSGWNNITAIASGYYHAVGLKSDGTVIACGNNDKGQCDVSNWTDIAAVFANECFTLGIKKDGTVVFAGSNDFIRTEIKSWKDIIQIVAVPNGSNSATIIGVKKDGTVISTKSECNSWNNVVAVSMGSTSYILALTAKGSYFYTDKVRENFSPRNFDPMLP